MIELKEQMMPEKRIKDMKQYVQELLSKGEKPVWYTKITPVKARPAVPGEKVITKLSDGHIETENPNIKQGDMLITNPTGEQYVIGKTKFEEKYYSTPDKNGFYRPKPSPQKFLYLPEDIVFVASWGEDQHMRTGSFINITNLDKDIYGIGREEFLKTYHQCTPDGQLLQLDGRDSRQ